MQTNRVSSSVPSLVFTSCHSSNSSSGSSADDARTPGVDSSPAPSPVFALDEDSRDSGYGGDNASAAISSVLGGGTSSGDSGIFLHPMRKPTTFRLWTKSKTMYDFVDEAEEDIGMFDDVMQVDDDNDALPSACAWPIASLLRDQIMYEGDKKPLATSQLSDSQYGTPLKRKSQSFRTRCNVDSEKTSPIDDFLKRSVISDENNGEKPNRAGNLDGPPGTKRRASPADCRFTSLRVPFKPVNRCHSESEALFSLPKDESCQLIGDHSIPHALPIMDRAHIHDLKCVSSDTLRRLISGDFGDAVGSFTLVDCRYPYEYEGGHIRGAINLYTQEQLVARMLDDSLLSMDVRHSSGDAKGCKRNILIFYCEFSRERGPKMTRFLRKQDRQLNEHRYPNLFYPEIYLLDGGYKNFYSSCSDLCHPQSYRPMHDENHLVELRKFRSKSKSWCSGGAAGDARDSPSSFSKRPGLNRGLFGSKGF